TPRRLGDRRPRPSRVRVRLISRIFGHNGSALAMKPRSVRALIVIASVVLLTRAGAAQLSDTFTNWIQHPAIAYQSRAAADPVAKLNQELKAGRVALTFDGPSGYLRSTLAALTIPIESQVALFNRDSLQN